MLIRSQDRKSLVDMSNKSISIINNNILVFGFETDISVALGEYSTKEKALKVLDMIEVKCMLVERNQFLVQGGQTNGWEHTIFQMPQDNEV